MKRPKKPIEFEPIPCEGSGHIALTIYPPGTWFADKDYKVVVGGCGHGSIPSLSQAKAKLLQDAKETCGRRIQGAERMAAHYRTQLARLNKEGLKRKRP